MLNQSWDFASKQTIFDAFNQEKPEVLGFTWFSQPGTDPHLVTDNGRASSERPSSKRSSSLSQSDTQPLPEAPFHSNRPGAVPGGARQTAVLLLNVFSDAITSTWTLLAQSKALSRVLICCPSSSFLLCRNPLPCPACRLRAAAPRFCSVGITWTSKTYAGQHVEKKSS